MKQVSARISIKLILHFTAFIIFKTSLAVSPLFAENILRLNITGQSTGTIDILLNDKNAPSHVERLKLLTREKQYDGVVFHRVISGFMAQTGDVKFGNVNNLDYSLVGMGGSEYPMLEAEFTNDPFLRGTVGMARSRDPNSANSQFFIMFERAPHLDGKYTIVGNVIDGIDTVLAIKKGSKIDNGAVNVPDYILNAEIISIQ